MRIGVLMGGFSSEREISLKSGMFTYKALTHKGYQCEPIDIIGGYEGSLQDLDEIESFVREKLKKSKIDIAFVALHGLFGEDGGIQKVLESMGIPYTGSEVEASYIAINKIISRKLFEKAGLKVPTYKIYNKNDGEFDLNNLNSLEFPLIVKPASQGSSVGLSKVDEPSKLKESVAKALGYGDDIILEEYVNGMEITVGILGERALPIIQIKPRNILFDFDAKYEDGQTQYIVPAPLEGHIYSRAQESCLAAHVALGCRDFSRVDAIVDRAGDTVILEVNTIPGLTQNSLLPKAAKAIGIDFPEICEKILELALGGRKTLLRFRQRRIHLGWKSFLLR